MKKTMFVFAGLIFSILVMAKETISGTVTSVIDGNTVEILAEDSATYKVMLHGIDCPELGQGYGDVAKQYLENLVLNKHVVVDVIGKNRLGVRQAVIVVGELDLRHELLREGLAWTSEVNPVPELEGMKQKAMEKRKGLWKESDPTPPWVFRRIQTRAQFKSS